MAASPTPDEVLIAGVSALVLIAVLFPILCAALFALRARPPIPRRFIFVVVTACLSYGLLFLFIVTVSIPLQLYTLFVAPPLQQAGRAYGPWLVSLGDFLASWGWLILPLVLAIASIAISRYLVQRWPKIIIALGG
jgi:hypothetical protein